MYFRVMYFRVMRFRGNLARAVGLCVALGAPAGTGAGAAAGEPRIDIVTGLVAPALTLDKPALRDIFLKRIVIDKAGKALVPLNLPPEHPARAAFSKVLLGKAPDALQRYWNERYFQGVSPPYVLGSQEAMLRFVAETPGALGYVASCLVDRRVRVVADLPVPPALASQVSDLCRSAGDQ